MRYTPTAQVASVNDRLLLTDYGQTLFYASNPQVQDKDVFNQMCSSEERTAAILGCYSQRRIYLFDIQNKDLDGTLEVTAAHEMLHAAYERLNFIEKATVNNLIERAYETHRNDVGLQRIMQYYEEEEPGQELNELHSLLGTTVADLDPELERYYSRYFTDRGRVVELNAKYNQVFEQISTRADVLEQMIDTEQPLLQQDFEEYEVDRLQLEQDIETFNERASSGGFTSQWSFVVARNALIARVDAMNTLRDQLNARVATYNEYINELNSLAIRVTELNKSMNGVTETIGL
ncbi:hypothetical protein EOL96_00130 [Candidatus Saccharibacteria bacterium]|nr:hypothetical protein [Candidatus Saccharibacteria bacterium]